MLRYAAVVPSCGQARAILIPDHVRSFITTSAGRSVQHSISRCYWLARSVGLGARTGLFVASGPRACAVTRL